MKLLDLQTGEYLEIGKDWVYFGEHIGILKADVLCGVQVEYVFSKIPHTNPIINQIAEKVGAVIYGGRYVLLNEIEVWVYNNDLPPTHIKTGDIVLHTPRRGYDTEILVNTNDFCTKLGSNHNKITFYLKDENLNFDDYGFFRIQKIHGNIFEEFAKKEQGLENKFDELQSEIMI